MERTWKFLSYLFHPLFMPTIGTFMVMWNDPLLYLSLDSLAPWVSVLGVVFICTAAVPLLFSIILVKMGRITSIYEPTEQDRKSLIAFAELGFLLAYLAFRNIPTLGHSIMFFLLGINITMVITLVVSFFKKISFHTTGIGGIVGTTIGLMYYTRDNMKYWVIGAMLAAILVGYARYKLKAHDTFELYLGYIVGIASLALVFIIGAK